MFDWNCSGANQEGVPATIPVLVIAVDSFEKDIPKSITQINETIELLEGFIHKVNEFESKHSSLKHQLKIFNSMELDQIEENIEKLNDDKNNLESKIKLFRIEIDENQEKIPVLYNEIECSLNSISGKKYSLNRGWEIVTIYV